jgi:hypothetical protein
MFRSAQRSPRAATGVRRFGVRRLAGAALVLAALTVPALVYAPSAEAAGWGSCYRVGSWSFKHYSAPPLTNLDGIAYINAWHNTNCSGSSVLAGQVLYTPSIRHITIHAVDYKADGYGVTVYTHGPSVTSNGHGTTVTGGGSLSSFNTPYNFWIRVGGQQNSHAQNFPLS